MKIKNIVDSHRCIKCDICCYFDESDKGCTPCFTEKEFASVPVHLRNNLAKDNTGFYRPQLIKPQKADEDMVCPFLRESTHECIIYDIRPLDCELWPFRLVNGRQGLSLIVVSEESCPDMNDKIDVAPEIIDGIIQTLQKRGVFGEIGRGERYVYGNEAFHVFLRSLDELLNKEGQVYK
jgi:Fe-S-cluster containining protein